MEKKYHFIGIGGIGMSGLARLLLQKKKQVSGSDIAESKLIEHLRKEGAKVHLGHLASHIDREMTVVYNTDIKKNFNPEYQSALDLGCACLHRSEMLVELMKEHLVLAVAGTHGKTTTTSLLTWVLESGEQSPSFMIGGIVPSLRVNASYGSGIHFVIEACESDGTFKNYYPYGGIVTNIDFDHMDYYGTKEKLIEAFRSFMGQVSSDQHLFWCGDDPHLLEIQPKGMCYGFGDHCQLKIVNYVQNQWSICFDIQFREKVFPGIEVSLTGKHNALNAAAVFGLALTLGIDEKAIRKGLASFPGVMRRCEKKGEHQGVLFLDDYGHHPTEISATLKGIREAIGERRLVVIYQPHRYSRAKMCAGLYEQVFNDADLLFVTEIYAANEDPIEGVSHSQILAEVPKGRFLSRAAAADTLVSLLRPHDVVVTLGAGDITKLGDEIIKQLFNRPLSKWKVALIFGGASVEHEVSLLSVKHIADSLRPGYYDIERFYISKKGYWNYQGQATQLQEKEDDGPLISDQVMERLSACDISFPVLHGTYGEDGTIQGFFELLKKPYVGCDYRSAALCMDKVATKRLLLQEGIPTSPFVTFSRYEWCKSRKMCLDKTKELTYPLFVKPSHLGSSIGVKKVNHSRDLEEAIRDAFRFDTNVLVENGIDGREIEFAVLGNDCPVVFPPGEILTGGKVYSYEDKYSVNGMKTNPKAPLSFKQLEEGMNLVKHAYKTCFCMGMARVDTFLDTDGRFWLNEINPIPGFTHNSLYPVICSVNGLQSQDLVDRLIILGLHRRRVLDSLEVRADCVC